MVAYLYHSLFQGLGLFALAVLGGKGISLVLLFWGEVSSSEAGLLIGRVLHQQAIHIGWLLAGCYEIKSTLVDWVRLVRIYSRRWSSSILRIELKTASAG